MGRMADIWKSAERGPATPLPVPGALLSLDAAPAPEMTDDDDVPFIEVGGPNLLMRHLDPIAPNTTAVKPVSDSPKAAQQQARTAPRAVDQGPNRALSPTNMTVRFEAVRGSLIAGRGFGPELIAFHQPDD